MINKEPMLREEILDIYSEKPNFGKLKNKTHMAKIKNTGCEDEINLELEIKNDKIINAAYTGSGCVISIAAASILTEELKGMLIKDAKKLTKDDMDEYFGMKVIPTKSKCELLTLDVLHKILKK